MTSRSLLSITLLFLLSIFLIGCSVDAVEQKRAASWASDTLERLSVREAVSQLIIMEIGDPNEGGQVNRQGVDLHDAEFLKPGGVHLATKNPYEAAAISAEIAATQPHRPFIVRQLTTEPQNEISILTDIVSIEALAVMGDTVLSSQLGRIVGKESEAIGVNLLLSEGFDRVDVSDSTTNRPHPVLFSTLRAFQSGLEESVVRMAKSVSLTGTYSDSLSNASGPLRIFTLNWDQNISTDSLKHMILSGFELGADLFLTSSNARRLRDTILRMTLDGEIQDSVLREKVLRVLRQKALLKPNLSPTPDVLAIRGLLLSNSNSYYRNEAARKSVVNLRDGKLATQLGVVGKLDVLVLTNDTTDSVLEFQNIFNEYNDPDAVTFYLTGDNDLATHESILQDVEQNATPESTIIIVQLGRVNRSVEKPLDHLVTVLASRQIPAMYAGLAKLDDAIHLPEQIDTAFITYGSGQASIRAITEAIAGMADVCGIALSDAPLSRSHEMPDCIPQRNPRPGLPGEVGLDAEKIEELGALLEEAIADSAFPGAAVAVGRNNVIAELGGFGRFTYNWEKAVGKSSIYDLASLTKVIATTTAVMQLYESQHLSLDDQVSTFLPEFGENDKTGITIRDLLTHTSGLIPFRPFYQTGASTRSEVLNRIMADSLIFEPGAESRYSDFGPIILAIIVEKVSGIPFDKYAQDRIFTPLGMHNTGYREASSEADDTIVPTENDDYFRRTLVQGSVHDENAYILGGTAGHAGLFSTVEDLARFAQMMLNEGKLGNEQFLRPETIRLFTRRVSDDYTHTRALGWDTKSVAGYSSAGRYFGKHAFGHTGFTGTSIWFDPDQDLYVILLTNRVYPTRDNSRHRRVRPAVANLVFEAIRSGPSSTYFNESE